MSNKNNSKVNPENTAEDAVELPEIFVPPEALENVDLSLPVSFQDEIMAADVLDHISVYHKMEALRKAARHQGQHDKAEKYAAEAAFARNAAALIQHEYPLTPCIVPLC